MSADVAALADPGPEVDPLDARRALHAEGLLRSFNEAGVLAAADVHVARRLATLAAPPHEDALLAAALAVRGPRLGHVCVDLATIRESAAVDTEDTTDLFRLPWPDVEPWLAPAGEALTIGHHGPLALVAEMQRMHYVLQGLLYTVALHRYLRWRLPGYDPDVNLAGVLYLFLRGMTGPDVPRVDGAPCGVFAWKPPGALVEALSDLLDRGVAA